MPREPSYKNCTQAITSRKPMGIMKISPDWKPMSHPIQLTASVLPIENPFTMTLPYQGGNISDAMVTTALSLPGFHIVRNIGVVRGIVVRSRSIVGSFAAGLQTIVGGNITIWTEMCEKARQDSYHLMLQHAREAGANAIIAMKYDANEVSAGVTEVLAYGTAVWAEPMQ